MSEPDWNRERPRRWFDPSRKLLRSIRDYQGARWALPRKLAVLRHRFWSVMAATDIPLTVQLGGGLLLPHPVGVVIHPSAVIGTNCLLFQNVTIGYRPGGYPVLEDGVDVGAGAVILGGVRIGSGARIGANAVVLRDVPAGAVAVGNPARIKRPRPAGKPSLALSS